MGPCPGGRCPGHKACPQQARRRLPTSRLPVSRAGAFATVSWAVQPRHPRLPQPGAGSPPREGGLTCERVGRLEVFGHQAVPGQSQCQAKSPCGGETTCGQQEEQALPAACPSEVLDEHQPSRAQPRLRAGGGGSSGPKRDRPAALEDSRVLCRQTRCTAGQEGTAGEAALIPPRPLRPWDLGNNAALLATPLYRFSLRSTYPARLCTFPPESGSAPLPRLGYPLVRRGPSVPIH